MTNSTSDRGRVLIVDDDRKVLDLLVELLRLEGYEIATATDGAEGFELAHSFAPDVVVSDVVMPILDGLELCRRLKEDQRTAYIPVLLISGIRKAGEAGLEGLHAGADDYLDLPFRNEELLVKVARLAERHRSERHRRESEERYRELFENANDIIYTHDLQGNFTSLNRTGERITGYSRAEAMKLNVADVIAPEYLNLARDMMAHKAAENVSTVYEIDLLSKKGRRVRLEVSTRLIFRDGKPIGVQGIARDLT
jgi:PAS domain S-box-containing protein